MYGEGEKGEEWQTKGQKCKKLVNTDKGKIGVSYTMAKILLFYMFDSKFGNLIQYILIDLRKT